MYSESIVKKQHCLAHAFKFCWCDTLLDFFGIDSHSCEVASCLHLFNILVQSSETLLPYAADPGRIRKRCRCYAYARPAAAEEGIP
eukprot:8255826-Lingulodinium_polyedra.AAC.1